MRRGIRMAIRGLLFLLLVCALLGLAAYAWLRQSLPRTSGELFAESLVRPVEILRDGYGIPHIFAATPEDAYYALGFVHAQDRLWQMEMSRRVAAGRLAEALGPAALETDRFLRTLGIRRSAQANLKHYNADTVKALEAYAAGVNAFLAAKPVLPPEFWLTGVRPEPWEPVDSIAWTKMMAWDLAGNWRSELLRMRLAPTLSNARIDEFLPPYPGDAAPALPELRELYQQAGKASRELAERFGEAPDFALGSNSWIVSGARSATGKPLLANDPHLGLTAPPVWYFAHLNAPGLDVIGATLPGVPGVVLGRNPRIAWGFTNTGPDVQDLYLEKLDDKGNYLTPEGPRPFRTFQETIKVKGRDDEILTVRVSRHGPVISDVLRAAQDGLPRGHVVSMAWTALAEDDLTVQGAINLGRAQDWPGFLAAARDFHAPQQNMSYADAAGTIAFIAAGRVPVRKPANDLKGLAPAPGWDERYDWAGYVPFDELPRLVNPPAGTVVTANEKVVPPGYGHHITFEWQPPYRASRIRALLGEAERHTLRTFAALQGDVVSLASRQLLEILKDTRPKSDEAREVLQQLREWDARMDPDRSEPLLFVAWWRELARGVYADELGDAFQRNWSARPVFLKAVLENRGGQARWCDNVRTAAAESCEDVAAEALEQAIAGLRRSYGPYRTRWRWGEAHVAHHPHRPLSTVSLLAPFFDIRVPSAGDAFTVNVGRSDFHHPLEPFANRHAPSLRALYDLAEPQNSLFIHSGGQSGNPLSRHYRSFSAAWARGDYIPMLTDRARLEAAGVQRLALVPRR
ncbi:MAG TPA: penicillin acylase family protein [Burkholderiales bacterium]|nr:penicillin acylase family protein [Burkholderiales bacterium]